VSRHLTPFFAVVICLAVTATAGAAACETSTTIDDWLQCRIQELQKQSVRLSSIEKQTEQPSLASGSTSLLDKTSGSDLMGVAFNMFAAGGSASQIGGGSPALSASAYALATASRGQNPLDPAIYDAGKNWRRFSFTLGHEDASEKENLDEARVFGGKVLILDYRDVSSRYAKNLLQNAAKNLGDTNKRYNAYSLRVRNFLYERLGPRIDANRYPLAPTPAQRVEFSNTELGEDKLQTTLALLTDDESREIDRIAEREGIVQAFNDEADALAKIVSQIRSAPQFAISYTGKSRDRSDTNRQFDEHRFAVNFDYGVADHINVTANASYDYRDSKVIGADKRGGRVAGELLFELNHAQALAKMIDPFTFSMAFEGKFLVKADNMFRAQGKVVVPLMNGISLPLSVTYANRSELIDESDIRGQFGFTFDLAKLALAFMLR
jgi:hypothetical protein